MVLSQRKNTKQPQTWTELLNKLKMFQLNSVASSGLGVWGYSPECFMNSHGSQKKSTPGSIHHITIMHQSPWKIIWHHWSKTQVCFGSCVCQAADLLHTTLHVPILCECARDGAQVTGLVIVGIWWQLANSIRQALKAMDIRNLFRKKKDEGNEVQVRLEEVELL